MDTKLLTKICVAIFLISLVPLSYLIYYLVNERNELDHNRMPNITAENNITSTTYFNHETTTAIYNDSYIFGNKESENIFLRSKDDLNTFSTTKPNGYTGFEHTNTFLSNKSVLDFQSTVITSVNKIKDTSSTISPTENTSVLSSTTFYPCELAPFLFQDMIYGDKYLDHSQLTEPRFYKQDGCVKESIKLYDEKNLFIFLDTDYDLVKLNLDIPENFYSNTKELSNINDYVRGYRDDKIEILYPVNSQGRNLYSLVRILDFLINQIERCQTEPFFMFHVRSSDIANIFLATKVTDQTNLFTFKDLQKIVQLLFYSNKYYEPIKIKFILNMDRCDKFINFSIYGVRFRQNTKFDSIKTDKNFIKMTKTKPKMQEYEKMKYMLSNQEYGALIDTMKTLNIQNYFNTFYFDKNKSEENTTLESENNKTTKNSEVEITSNFSFKNDFSITKQGVDDSRNNTDSEIQIDNYKTEQEVDVYENNTDDEIDDDNSQPKQEVDNSRDDYENEIDVDDSQSKQQVNGSGNNHNNEMDVDNSQPEQGVDNSRDDYDNEIDFDNSQPKQQVNGSGNNHDNEMDVDNSQLKQQVDGSGNNYDNEIDEDDN